MKKKHDYRRRRNEKIYISYNLMIIYLKTSLKSSFLEKCSLTILTQELENINHAKTKKYTE